MLFPRISLSPAIRRLSSLHSCPAAARFQASTTTSSQQVVTLAKRSIATFKSIQEEIDNANTCFDNVLSVRDTDDRGWGVYVTRDKAFKAGETVLSSAVLSETKSRHAHTIQVNWDKHVIMDLPARFIDHSCDPNLGIRNNEGGAYDFVAKRDIEVGEELLWDYESTEWEVSAFETCLCGAWNCRKHMGGFKLNGEKLKELHGDLIADYLKDATIPSSLPSKKDGQHEDVAQTGVF